MTFDLLTLLLLFATGLTAGCVDAIAGGGGLISLPILLSLGISPAQTLATNKLQSSIGTSMACYSYWKHGLVHLNQLKIPIFFTFLGSIIGSYTVGFLDGALLDKVIPYLLIAFALYFTFSPRISDSDSQQRISLTIFGLFIGTSVGFYDGFFGPGTGSFFTIGFIILLGYNLKHATANTKVLNLTSNLAALSIFIFGGHVLWPLGLIMAAGQIIGARIGAQLAVNKGVRLIKPVLIIVSIAMSIKLLIE